MPICPNCNYKIVLLSYKPKYKCALCSKLFSQREIDNKEFRNWNLKQRRLDLEILKSKKKTKLTEEEKINRKRIYQEENKERLKEYQRGWREKNRDSYNQHKRDYWNKNSDNLNSKRRERYSLQKQQLLKYQKKWQQNNQYKFKIKKRLTELREQQKILALQLCKYQEHNLYIPKIKIILPTFYFPIYC